jgi:hypothetical protein
VTSRLLPKEVDYGGWPDISELPVTSMTEVHKQALILKCTKKKDVEMPNFGKMAASPTKTIASENSSNTLFTPSPNSGLSTQTNHFDGIKNVTPSPAIAAASSKVFAKPSMQLLELHRKWQGAAEAVGGPCARIVVGKPDAKKIIFDLLYESFRPMNITEIHKVRSFLQFVDERFCEIEPNR